MGRRRQLHKHLPPRMYLDGPTFYWRGYVGGKQRRIPIGRTFAEAIAEYGKLESQRVESPHTMKALIDKFLADKRQPRAKATQKNYAIWGRQLIAIFGHMKPHQIQGHHAAKLLDEHPKRVTAQRLVGLLSNVLGYAVRIGWMPGPNPLYGFDKGPKAKRTRYITDTEWSSILEASPAWLALFLRFLYHTALRKGDAMALRWSSVKEDGVHVPIQKTKAALVFDRDAEMAAILDGLKDLRRRVVGLHVFSTRHGKPYDYSTVMRNYKAACEAVGVPDATLHDIRRKRLTDIERAHGLQLAQRIAAHTDPRTTAGYIVSQEVRVSLPSR
jgi:integrase